MAKPTRSPVLGYNHNIRYHGRVFHVQSEDSGPINPRVFTHLFYGGTILVSKKHAYDAVISEDAVRLLMQQQHKQVIKDLTRGALDEGIASFFAARGEPAILVDEKGAQVTPAPAAEAPPAGDAGAPSGPIVVMGSGMYNSLPAPARQPVVSATPPGGSRALPTPRPAVVARPPDMRRSPVVMSSSADGVVVQRNIVIGVGAPTPSINIAVPRGRSSIPFVSRDAAHASSNGTPPPRAATPEPATAAVTARPRTPQPERSFSNELVLDKSLDEVILEYLSDETEE
jgi:hypothetical protein